MKQLGANVVRVHLQFGKFMTAPDKPNPHALKQLRRLVELAERLGLYLDVTGLGCYHKQDVPAWYDVLPEQQRWAAQAGFWEAIAESCSESPAIFCYDLMNEPVVSGGPPKEDWLGPPFDGKHFVQYVAIDDAGRDRRDDRPAMGRADGGRHSQARPPPYDYGGPGFVEPGPTRLELGIRARQDCRPNSISSASTCIPKRASWRRPWKP